MTIIIVFDGDIGEEKGVDSVTNAANQMLNVGLGVAGAIGRACGKPALTKECDEFIRDLQSHTNLSRVPVGSCAITSAFNMAPTQAILHTPAPAPLIHYQPNPDEQKQLRRCYDSVFNLAESYGYKSIAVCFLGAGIFKYPGKESVEVGLTAALAICPSSSIDLIRFVSIDKAMVKHMVDLLGGYSVTVNTMADVQQLLSRIPIVSRTIGGAPSNEADIIRCLNFSLDSAKWAARILKNTMIAPPLPPTKRPTSLKKRISNIVTGKGQKKTIELKPLDQAIQAPVDVFVVFGESYDHNDIRIDLGVFANTDIHRDIVDLLKTADVSDTKWIAVTSNVSIPSNALPKLIVCIARQHLDADVDNFVFEFANVLTNLRRNVNAEKIGVIIPTTCLFVGKWRIIWPIFVLLSLWKKGGMIAITSAVLLWSPKDKQLVRKILCSETNFTMSAVNKVLKDMEKNDLLKYIDNTDSGFTFRVTTKEDHLIKPVVDPSPRRSSSRQLFTTPTSRSQLSQLPHEDEACITQLFRDLLTDNARVTMPNSALPHTRTLLPQYTTISFGKLRDFADEEGDALCIPIDKSLTLNSDVCKQLLQRCGVELEKMLKLISDRMDYAEVDRDVIRGTIIPLPSYNLRRFKIIMFMINVEVASTSSPTVQEKWLLHESYKKVVDLCKMAKCNRVVVTISSCQSGGFRIREGTSIATAAILEMCPNRIASIHFALNEEAIDGFRATKLFEKTTNATVDCETTAIIFAGLFLPTLLEPGIGFPQHAMDIMNSQLNEIVDQSDVASQTSQQLNDCLDNFEVPIYIIAESEIGDQLSDGDGRVIMVGRLLDLQADLTGSCGHTYSEALDNWAHLFTQNPLYLSRKMPVGEMLLTTNFNCPNYRKGLSHIVLKKALLLDPSKENIVQARRILFSGLQQLEDVEAMDVVVNVPSNFFSPRYASIIVLIAIIDHIRRETSSRKIQTYRIVDMVGPALEELKVWINSPKKLNNMNDVDDLIKRIIRKRCDANLIQNEHGEIIISTPQTTRRLRTKEPRSEEHIRDKNKRIQSQIREDRTRDERALYYKDVYARRKAKKSNQISWEFSEKYKTLPITRKIRTDFFKSLKLIRRMRKNPNCSGIVQRYKYFSNKAIRILTLKETRGPNKKRIAKMWNSIKRRPELIHQMFTLSIIRKMIKTKKSKYTTLHESVAHYQYLTDVARQLMLVGSTIASREGRLILQQLNRPVLHLEGASEDDNLVRRIGRLRFHIAPPNYRGEKVAMVDGIQQLMRDWRGVPELVDDASEHVTMEVDNADEMRESIDQGLTEGIILTGILASSQHVSSQRAFSQAPRTPVSTHRQSLPGEEDVEPIEVGEAVERAVEDDQELEEAQREDVYEEEYEEVERNELITTINNNLSTVPRDVLEQAQEEIEQILSAEPDMRDHGPPLPEILLPFTTYIHLCDEDGECERLTGDHCRFIISKVQEYVDLVKREDFPSCTKYFEELQEGEDISALGLLKKMAPCYSGIRTILNRYYKLRSSIRAMRRGHRALKGERIDQLKLQLSDRMPSEIRLIISKTLAALYTADQSHFKEKQVRKDNKQLMKAYNKKMKRMMEILMCKICHTYVSKEQSVANPKRQVPSQYIRDPNIGTVYCNKCMNDIGRGKLAKLRAPQNLYETAEIPAVLKNLNWIERLLIQLTRPVINTVTLRDKGGRKTKMKATKGAMIFLPVPTEGTLSHVARTLPSAANMKIIVTLNNSKTIVCMERILEALRYLKANHPEYKDILIDENFTFPEDSIVGGPQGGAQLIAQNESDPTLIEHQDIGAHIIQDVGGEGKMMKGIAYEQYKLKRNPYFPISLDINHPDTRAFPWLFPNGNFGFHAAREKNRFGKDHTERDVAKWQLQYRDRRFATDPSYLSFVHGLLEGKNLLSSVALRAKMSRGKLTTASFLQLLQEGSPDFQISMSTIACKLRGRDAFWVDAKRTLQSHISTFGPPTWFVTLNPSIGDWPDMLKVYKNAYPSDDINETNMMDWISADPYFFARQFQNRLRVVMSNLLLKEGGPLGTVTHFFHRIEYQQRGTQHIHLLLWCLDGPSKDATEAEKLAYISKHATARMPCEKTEKELHRIITKHQMHYSYHSKTCLRTIRYGQSVIQKCRFDFPRPALSRAKFNKAARTLTSIPTTFKKAYYLARKEGDEQMINDYNPLISLLWKGNTDIQFVTDLPHIIPYLTSYTSKGESGKSGNVIQESLRSAMDNKAAYRSLQDMLRMREMGLLEMVDLILGHELHKFDSDHIFINTNKQDTRQRVLHSKDVLDRAQQREGQDNEEGEEAMMEDGGEEQQQEEDEQEEGGRRSGTKMAFKDNMYDNYYPNRPAEMEKLSLFQCLTHFTTDKKGDDTARRENASHVGDGHNKFGNPFRFHYNITNPISQFYNFADDPNFPSTKLMPIPKARGKNFRRLKKPKVGRFFFPHLDTENEESREDYYRRLCMSFIPWRIETELLSAIEGQTFDSYDVMWKHFTDKLKDGSPNDQAALADIEKLIHYHTFLLDAQAEAHKTRAEMRKRMEALEVEEDPEQGDMQVFGREVNDDRMKRDIGLMNEGQKAIFDEILKGIELQEEHKVLAKEVEEDEALSEEQKNEKIGALPKVDAIRFVISGTAGTGKSFLINNLADYLTVKYCPKNETSFNPAVCITAPTGIAAVQIRGSTIHSLFSIEVQKNSTSPLSDMALEKLSSMRALLRNVRLFIIDEMSMVSNVLLAKINLRLQELYSSDEMFGGRNIILLGDLMQLPPVRASKIFENLHEYEITKMFGGGVLPTANFFNFFIYRELIENMRQKNDAVFGSIMLNARVQALTETDVQNLRTRIIPNESGDTVVSFDEAAQFYVVKNKEDPAILALFATNAEVDSFNKIVMDALRLEIITIEASDSASFKSRANNDDADQQRSRTSFARAYQEAPNDLFDDQPASDRRKQFGKRGKRGKGKQAFTEHEEDSNITAGLPKVLRVAINGRVMLRRNINAAIGLVNGATGTLKEVERIEDDIIFLVIKFDGIEDIQKIPKLTAVFEVGLDDQIARTQFPIVSAFAATVHKCQGLTLQNVLISTRSFFAPGMAFVAFSRVTTMNGLHLMDFKETNVWCDLPSLKKYNDLRASIGLEKYAVPQRKRTFAPIGEGKGSKGKKQPPPTTVPVRNGTSVVPTRNGVSCPGLRFGFDTPIRTRRRPHSIDSSDDEAENGEKKRRMISRTTTTDSSKRTRISLRKILPGKGKKLALDDASDVTSANSSPEKNKKMRVTAVDKMKNVVVNTAAILRRTPQPQVSQSTAADNDDSCLVKDGFKMGYRFNNRGSDCFANVATNSFLCLESLMRELEGAPNKSDEVELLLKVYSQSREDENLPIKNNQPLRDKLYPTNEKDANGRPIDPNEQDDPDDMIRTLIENMDFLNSDGVNIQNHFELNLDIIVPCRGGCKITWRSSSYNRFMLKIGHIDGLPGTIEEQVKKVAAFNAFGEDHAVTTGCTMNALDETQPIEVLVNGIMMPRYLFISIETDEYIGGVIRPSPVPITGGKAKNMRIFGTRYQMRGAIQYNAESGTNVTAGHYIFWWKTNKWSLINDRRYSEVRTSLPKNWSQMRLLVFEKE